MNNPEWGNGLLIINPIAEWPEHWIWDYSVEAYLEQCSFYQEAPGLYRVPAGEGVRTP